MQIKQEKNGAREKAANKKEVKYKAESGGERSNINFINWYAKEPQRDAPIGKVLFINKVLPPHRTFGLNYLLKVHAPDDVDREKDPGIFISSPNLLSQMRCMHLKCIIRFVTMHGKKAKRGEREREIAECHRVAR